MTAKQSRRRAWFQLHLSTCVVLMIGMSAALLLNLRPNYKTTSWPAGRGETCFSEYGSFGFPVEAYNDAIQYRITNPEKYENGGVWGIPVEQAIPRGWQVKGLLIDIASAFTVLAVLAFVLEWRIRRRNRKVPSSV